MISKRRVVVAAVVAAVALVVTACGGGVGGGGAAAGAVAPSGDPVPGGSATVLLLSEARTLDPAFGANTINGAAPVMNGIFGTLLVTDPETGEILPSLASSFSTPDNGKTFELTLREGLTFSDGSPFEASAIAAHWNRLKDPATGSSYQADASFVESMEVVAPTTLRATMVTPVPNFGHSIVTTVMNWVPKPEAIAAGGTEFDANPIGAGPYILQEWRRQDATVLVRNPNYWDAPRPYLDQITFRAATDASQRLNTVVSGGVDVALESNWHNLQKAEQSNLVVQTQPLNGGNYLAMNTRRAPFDDLRARKAVSLALDPQAINVSVFGGAAEMVDTVFTPSSPLHAGVATPEPDKVEAQRLFDELAAEGRPVTFTIATVSTSESRETSEAIQAQLSAFQNVTADIEVMDLAALSSLTASENFDATVSAAAFLDPEPRLSTAFGGDSQDNRSGIDDPELNAALLTGRTSTSVEERKAAYEVVQHRLQAVHPGVWLNRNSSSVVSSKQVGGVTLYGFGSLRPEELWIQR